MFLFARLGWTVKPIIINHVVQIVIFPFFEKKSKGEGSKSEFIVQLPIIGVRAEKTKKEVLRINRKSNAHFPFSRPSLQSLGGFEGEMEKDKED